MGNYLWNKVANDPAVDVNAFVIGGQISYSVSISDGSLTQKNMITIRFRHDDFSRVDLCRLRDCIKANVSIHEDSSHEEASHVDSSRTVHVQSTRGGAVYVQDGMITFLFADVQASYPVEWFVGTFPRIIQLLEYDAGPWWANVKCLGETCPGATCGDVSAAEFGDGDLSAVGDTDDGAGDTDDADDYF
jgi:hypothetical protein